LTLSLNIPDFTRYGRGQREQALGQALGLPTTMLVFSAMAVVITGAAQALLSGVDPASLWDPVVVLSHITSSTPPPGHAAPLIDSGAVRVTVAVLALLGVGIATLATNIAANVVSPANDFANTAPRLISFKTGAVITGVLGFLMMPWKLINNPDTYIFEWLIGYSALLGPIAGIMITDYWIVRGRRLDVADLYRPRGRYAGVNAVAVVALVAGVAPNVPGFLQAVRVIKDAPAFFSAVYPYAWFTGVLIAGAVYLIGMRLKKPV
ncbi:MAG TPA: cytosine permease, partial [Phycisphaerales bacterium]|nr:cytosine permease [Phycisphaerales bacterium]